jgi:hypothetical protein
MDARWLAWRARAVEGDRQRALIMTGVSLLLALSFAVWAGTLLLL